MDFPGLFDSIAASEVDQRVASRRALALADTRIENKMGLFLRGARTEEEFWDRLGLIQEDFDYHIASAAEEVGYDHPEYITKTLIDHYRLASIHEACKFCGEDDCDCCQNCGKKGGCEHSHKEAAEVEFQETPTEEDEQEQEKESSLKVADNFLDQGVSVANPMNETPIGADSIAPMVTPYTGPATTPAPANPALNATQGVPNVGVPGTDPNALDELATQPQQPITSNWQVVTAEHWIQDAIKRPGALHEKLDVPEGEKIPEDKLEEAKHSDDPKEREEANLAETLKGFHHGSYTGGDFQGQPDEDPYFQILLEALGGNYQKALAYYQKIPQNNQQQVADYPMQQDQSYYANFKAAGDKEHYSPADQELDGDGASVLDALDESGPKTKKSNWQVKSESGNTDLDGPEPKIDKEHQTDDNPKKDQLGNEDKGRWPTKQKDITVPIKAENREVGGKPNHELKEIGENTTKHEDLPTARNFDNSGFADGGIVKDPDKYQWTGTDGQTDPVTKTKQTV